MTIGCRLYGPQPARALESSATQDRRPLFARLAEAMKDARRDAPDDNPRIPSGYTYLAQFAAHDLVFSGVTRPRLGDPGQAPSAPISPEHANSALDLGSLYGPGPDIRPELYQPAGRMPRTRLALAPMPDTERSFLSRAAWTSTAPQGPEFCVLPRLVAQLPEMTAVTADPRNNLHYLISQVTVLFACVHNAVVDRVEAREPAGSYDGARVLATARTIVLAAYRDIILHDFLARLLDDATHARVVDACARASFDGLRLLGSGSVDAPVSRAFASAAYRVGHTMARGHYALSAQFAENKPASLSRLISLAAEPSAPARIWSLEWDRFFFDDTAPRTPDGRLRNFSHLIKPGINLTLHDEGFFPGDDGVGRGLAYRDMVRCAADGMDDTDAFVAARMPGVALLEPAAREALLAERLPGLDAADRAALAARMPLALYVLLEAQHAGGHHLGPVASAIVGEVFGAGLIESEAETARGRALWRDILGQEAPRRMTGLLSFLRTQTH
ncbi:peroxidase family protein [Paroceanicella profunda]|nr:peroxidase family protein [Paroceanicella profunda]